jgi:predicted MFS family arabinose efflux permease
MMTYFNGAFTLGFSASIVFLGIVAERFGCPLVCVIAGFLAYLAATVLWLSKSEPHDHAF